MSGFDFEVSGIVQGARELTHVFCETDVVQFKVIDLLRYMFAFQSCRFVDV